jgi:hypothetical protein
MKPAERLEWLETEIDNIVKRYKTESTHYKKVAFRLKIVSVFLAAFITVFLGLKLKETRLTEILSNASLVLSAAITVLSAYEAFFDPRALWVRETVTFARLKDLERDILFWKSGKDTEDINLEELDGFKLRLDQILADTLKYWMKIRGANDLDKALDAKADLQSKENPPQIATSVAAPSS